MMTGIRGKHSVFLPAVTWDLPRQKMDYHFFFRWKCNFQAKIVSPRPLEYRQQNTMRPRNFQNQKCNDLKWGDSAASITGKNNLRNIRTIPIWQSYPKSHLFTMYYVWWQKEQIATEYMIKQWKHSKSDDW